MLFLNFFLLFFSVLCNAQSQWIIVTTINYPTEAIKKLTSQKDWRVVIVADKKTPKDWYCENCDFLSVEKQSSLGYEIFKHLPWNHYSRKNIGYLYAIEHGAKVIYETDDDNIIKTSLDYLPELSDINVFHNNNFCVNPYAYFGQPTVWPRGYPLEYILKKMHKSIKTRLTQISIQQGIVDNDPDVDAIFRLTRGELLTFTDQAPIALSCGTMCPFNSQNTFFHYSAFWGLLIPITTSFRVCDIWRGYVTQRLLWDIGGNLCFTKATAIQERNEHDLLKDFIDEQDLYYKAGKLVRYLIEWKSNKKTLFERMIELHEALIEAGYYKPEELNLVKAWVSDLQRIGYKPPLIQN